MSSGDSYKSEYIIKIKIEYSYSITLKKGFLQPLNIYLVLKSIKRVIDKRIKYRVNILTPWDAFLLPLMLEASFQN